MNGDGATEYDFAAGAAWGMERAAKVVETIQRWHHADEIAAAIRKLGNLTKPGELPAKGTA